MHNWIDIKFIH